MVYGQQLPCDSCVLTYVDDETFAELPWSDRVSRLHLFAWPPLSSPPVGSIGISWILMLSSFVQSLGIRGGIRASVHDRSH